MAAAVLPTQRSSAGQVRLDRHQELSTQGHIKEVDPYSSRNGRADDHTAFCMKLKRRPAIVGIVASVHHDDRTGAAADLP